MTPPSSTGASPVGAPPPAHVVLVAPAGSTPPDDADGVRAIESLAEGALDLGIRWLTLQVPWRAASPAALVATVLERRGVELASLPPEQARSPDPTSVPGTGPPLTVTLAAPRSGRDELVEAVRRLAEDGLTPDEVDEKALASRLWAPEVPDPDLVVHTGRDRRVPDLLLWEVAYSELVYLDEPWPHINRAHLLEAVADYQRRDRRYGGIVTGEVPAMSLIRVTVVAGIVVFGLLCWLAAIGAGPIREVLIAVVAMVALVGGGNWLSGNGYGRTPGRRPASSTVPDDEQPRT